MDYLKHYPTSIYLHIPFCTTKCTYCAFNTYTHLEHLIDGFVDALAAETRIAGRAGQRPRAGTIFFGGGTPSLLTLRHYEILFSALYEAFDIEPGAEITFEANPNDISYDYVRDLKAVGFNRVSLGVQTVHASELALFRRRHDNDQVAQAVAAARRAGYDSLNLDLIYGFPHHTMENWRETLAQTLALQPEHVSLYGLVLEENTPMLAWVEGGRVPEPDDDLAAEMYEVAGDMMQAAGYGQYEISNWAKPGYECRHNLQYWWNHPYVGLGPGAHGYANGVRYATLLSPQRYIKSLRDASLDGHDYPHTPAVQDVDPVTRDGEITDTLLMGLRLTGSGINRHEFQQRFGEDVMDARGEILARHAATGLLEVSPERVRLTTEGRLLSNLIFRDLV